MHTHFSSSHPVGLVGFLTLHSCQASKRLQADCANQTIGNSEDGGSTVQGTNDHAHAYTGKHLHSMIICHAQETFCAARARKTFRQSRGGAAILKDKIGLLFFLDLTKVYGS